MNRRSLLLLLVLAAQLVLPRLQGADRLNYLPAGSPDVVALLPPPPATGSAEAAADLATTRNVSHARTPEQTASRRRNQADHLQLRPRHRHWFQPGRFPKAEAFFRQIQSDTSAVADVGKSYFKRPRPYAVDPSIIPLKREESFSYPSGHSTRGTVFALVLAELFPAHREALLSFGYDTGWNRIVAGVHYPSDVFSGRVLGRAIVREMLKDPAFLRDLAETKANSPQPGPSSSS